MPAFRHFDEGRSEAQWLSSERWNEVSRLEIESGCGIRRLVLLAAHPDDETLGAGGLLHNCSSAGIPVEVVVATDGEASHPDSTTHSRTDLARLRRAEVAEAVSTLAPPADVCHLGLPDGELASNVETLLAVIRARVDDVGVGAVIAAPWRHDGHPDHDTLGQVAADVAGQTGALLVEYPIWAWHWATVDDLPWSQLRVLPLGEDTVLAKRRSLAAHTTQVRPLSDKPGDEVLLSPQMLAHFDRPFETFVDSSGLMGEGIFERLHRFDPDPWRVRDSDYESRKREATLAVLPPGSFARAYEPGCSIGELSAALAPRCDELICQDVSSTAVAQATVRLTRYPHVRVAQGATPGDWPGGRFDLIVLSEVGYFLSATELDAVLHLTRTTLACGGHVVLCHWRHPIDGWELDGTAVHARAAQLLDLPLRSRHLDEDFALEVYGPC